MSHQFNSLLDPQKNGQEKGGQTWDNIQMRGGGVPAPTLFTQKMGFFHEKIICLK